MALERGVLHPAVAALDLDLPAQDVEATVSDLLRLHLLRPRHGGVPGSRGGPAAGGYLASSPEVAVTHLVGPIEAEIRQLRRRADELTDHAMAMKPVFDEAWQGHFMKSPVEYLNSLDAIRTALERIAASARVEVLAAHPQVPPPEALEDGYRRTADPVGRGILCRTLYPHSVLSHGYMRQHMTRMSALGVEFRTIDRIPDRILLFDASTAVISDPEQPSGQGALVVRDPSMVSYLYRSWESVWESARPFGDDGASETRAEKNSPKNELRRSILRQLEMGTKDEVSARRLAMSITTYRRHVTELMTDLNAQSRFQAGSYARRAGWLDE
ncbi:hypothetical protein ACFWUQ_00385 [Streptomyces sp. NPDC058662]|uniref:hypothetical protein n=1 Tax=Streptomyces sp. NPDC058662 TaxID=3346583 RepID=UPI003658002F